MKSEIESGIKSYDLTFYLNHNKASQWTVVLPSTSKSCKSCQRCCFFPRRCCFIQKRDRASLDEARRRKKIRAASRRIKPRWRWWFVFMWHGALALACDGYRVFSPAATRGFSRAMFEQRRGRKEGWRRRHTLGRVLTQFHTTRLWRRLLRMSVSVVVRAKGREGEGKRFACDWSRERW